MNSLLRFTLSFLTLFILFTLVNPTTHAVEEKRDFEKVTILFENQVDLSIIPSERITYQFDSIPAYSALLTANEIEAIRSKPNIEMINIEKPVTITSTQSKDWGHEAIGVPTMLNASLTGKNVKIAIIDTGIDGAHPDLNVAGGKNFIENNSNYKDDNGHGTHVAGIIASLNNEFGTLGVAPNSSIYALKFLDSNGEGSTTDLANAIDWAIEHNIDILNMSFGFTGSDPIISELLNKAYMNNMLIVGAAGNEGLNSVAFPASNRNVIAVGAINKQKQLAAFSNTGPQLEVTAPGVGVISTYINNQYKYMDGTSMATPYVSGYLALLMEKYPTKTNAEIRSLLTKNTLDLGVTGRDTKYGYGLIQSFISESEGTETKSPENPPFFQAVGEKVPIYDNRSGSLVNVGYLEENQVYRVERHFTGWYQIRFGSYSVFVRKDDTLPITNHNLQNLSNSIHTINRDIIVLNDTLVYDNSSGSLVAFGTIKASTTFTISSNYTSWVGVNFGGRVGYVKKDQVTMKFLSTDAYFKVTNNMVPVYDNRSGSLIIVGYLTKGETYAREKDYTSWHQISFGSFKGYVPKNGTEPASSLIGKKASTFSSSGVFTTKADTLVYDNSTGKLIPFLTLNAGVTYPIVKNYTSWYEINIAGRTGFIKK
ncbi:MAG: S8 family serine peptidase [Bacillota bacterium]